MNRAILTPQTPSAGASCQSSETTVRSAVNLVKFNRLDRCELVADEAVRMGGQVVAVAP